MKSRIPALCLCSLLAGAVLVSSCRDSYPKNLPALAGQLKVLVAETEADSSLLIPHSLTNDGELKCVKPQGWTSGFFPGSLWYMYELTGDEYWAEKATLHTEILDSVRFCTRHHDVGFIMQCSYGNGLRLKDRQEYADILVQTARSLCTRFRPAAGVIQSWNARNGWACPVIIDNMMNLELLFEASKLSGDDSFRQIAISHANTTMANHFRADNSSYHVVDYDPETGEIRQKCTSQGYNDDSAWSRGQAWGLYGYTMCYRYTGDRKYLDQAEKIASFIFSNPTLPEDLVPYWDYNAPEIPDEPRDASAAAVTASALCELYTYTGNKDYLQKADKIIESLSSPAYLCAPGQRHGFLLDHSVTHKRRGTDVDKPLSYADYYYLEALVRRRGIK